MKSTYGEIIKAWKDNNGPTPVITSGNDSTHRTDSLHYKDNAIDIRGNNIPNKKGRKIAKELRELLGDDYYVDFEEFPKNPDYDHIHIEYQPK